MYACNSPAELHSSKYKRVAGTKEERRRRRTRKTGKSLYSALQRFTASTPRFLLDSCPSRWDARFPRGTIAGHKAQSATTV